MLQSKAPFNKLVTNPACHSKGLSVCTLKPTDLCVALMYHFQAHVLVIANLIPHILLLCCSRTHQPAGPRHSGNHEFDTCVGSSKSDVMPHCPMLMQMIQAEADEQERRAIQQHMYRAFNDLSGEATSDSNPLARPNKLTRTNPLL